MALTRDKAVYIWHRHLEGADPEKRTLVKWNKAYPKDKTTLAEITGFISEMRRLSAAGFGDSKSMDTILAGGPVMKVFKKVEEEPAPVAEKPKRSWTRKKKT